MKSDMNEMRLKLDAASVARMVKEVCGRELAKSEADKYLDVFETDLTDAAVFAVREFLKNHFAPQSKNGL